MTAPISGRLAIANDTRKLPEVRQFLSRLIRTSLLPPDEENRVILAVDEAVSNIIEHGFGSNAESRIEISVEADAAAFTISILDSGKHFDPTGTQDPDIVEHVRQGRRKGLGIFLMRQVMDEIRYETPDPGCNRLTLVRRIRSSGGTPDVPGNR